MLVEACAPKRVVEPNVAVRRKCFIRGHVRPAPACSAKPCGVVTACERSLVGRVGRSYNRPNGTDLLLCVAEQWVPSVE